MRKTVAVVFTAIALLAGLTVFATTASAAVVPLTSGTKCADSYGFLGSSYHVCGKVYGTGLDVSYVTFQINVTTKNCGYAEVTTPYEDFWSKHGCAQPGGGVNSFSGTIEVGVGYASPGPLDIWWVNDPGYGIFKYPDGFEIS